MTNGNSGSNKDFVDSMNLPAEKKHDVVPSFDFIPVQPAVGSSSPTAPAACSSNLDSGNEDVPLRTWNSVDSASPVRGENEDVEVVKINQPTTLPKKQFTRDEDDALISAFINVSIGANQKKEAFWNRIKAWYDEARKGNPAELRERSTGMLNNRFRRISSGVMKFVDCHAKVSRQRERWMNEDDIFKCALDLYGENFYFGKCWLFLENYPMYKEVFAAYGGNNSRPQDDFRPQYRNVPMPTNHDCLDIDGSRKRARVRLNECEFSTEFDGGEGASKSARRPVVKAVKKKCKGKADKERLDQLSESLINLAKTMKDPKYLWEKLNFSKSKEAARRAEKQAKFDLERQKIEIESRNMKMQLLHTLLEKENLDEGMEKVKNGLLKQLGF